MKTREEIVRRTQSWPTSDSLLPSWPTNASYPGYRAEQASRKGGRLLIPIAASQGSIDTPLGRSANSSDTPLCYLVSNKLNEPLLALRGASGKLGISRR
jgi:hypothetical protein